MHRYHPREQGRTTVQRLVCLLLSAATLPGCEYTPLDPHTNVTPIPPAPMTVFPGSLPPRVTQGSSLKEASSTEHAIDLNDVTNSTGVNFVHTDGGGQKQYIVQTVASGLALLDYDNDGLTDIYFLNGGAVPGTKLATPPTNKLFRNLGGWRFRDVTVSSGVDDAGYGLGVAAADYDNDGDVDLYVSNFGPNAFYRNNGDGTFDNITTAAALESNKFGAGVAFLDVDRNGVLDIYVANYVDFTYDDYKTRTINNYEFPAAPSDYAPQPDTLFLGNGDGTFADATDAAGIANVAEPSMGVICTDVDADRDIDIVVCCDNRPNLLLINDGFGHFTEQAQLAGIAVDWNGGMNGSMGVDAGDYDNDGRVDLYITNYQGEMSMLCHNLGGGVFSDTTRSTNASRSSMPQVKWGAGLVDFDSDGWRDLFVACGHFVKSIEYLDDRAEVNAPNHLLRNDGQGRFVDISESCGSAMEVRASTRGAAFDDMDNDGDIDIVLSNANSPPTLIRNDTTNGQRSVLLELIGTAANRSAVGAKVFLSHEGRTQVAEVYAGRGYQSHYGTRLHFGLGSGDDDSELTIDTIEVDWGRGVTDTYSNVPLRPGAVVQLVQGHDGWIIR